MENNQIQPIHLIAQELAETKIELANYKIAYETMNAELKELRKLKETIDSNEELKSLVEEEVNDR
ncbi:hypothetical protein O3794_02885 [Gemella sanguinis]|uniref:hypothetical protein n=1 Tax=Gemella sanguinis TaxID=84135 RepID=UPI00352E6ECD